MNTTKMEPIEIKLPQDIIFAMKGLEKPEWVKKKGSSRISVKGAKFCKDPELEVGEIPVSESPAYGCP